MPESPVVTGCSISCPAIFISNGACDARLTRRQLQVRRHVSLSLSLCLISKPPKYKAAPGRNLSTPCSSDLFPRIRLSLCPGRLPGAAAGVSAPYHGCYHTRDCTDLSVQGRKPRQGYLRHSPPPKHFLSRDDNDPGEGGEERNESTRVFARQPRICLISFITHC